VKNRKTSYAKKVTKIMIQLREKAGFSQAEFAKALKIAPNQMWIIENGMGLWRLDLLKAASGVLAISMPRLFKMVDSV